MQRNRPLAIFGHVGILVQQAKGEYRDVVITDETGTYNIGFYYFVKGHARSRVLETGEMLPDRLPGYLNIEHPGTGASTAGTIRSEYLEDTAWLCLPYKHNRKRGLPTLQSVILDLGESVVIPNNTNFYLVSGMISKDDKTFTGPYAIQIRSGDALLQNIGNDKVYGLKVT